MVLFKYASLTTYKHCLFYTEGNYLLNVSVFSIRKIKVFPFILFFQKNSSFLIYKSIFCNFSVFNLLWQSCSYLIQDFFFSTMLGYYHGFRLLGRGYKAYLHLNNFVFRLGYSHNIYYILPLSFKTQFKEKMRNFWIVRGLDKTKLSIIVNSVRSFRIPNAYRHKGIYGMNDTYKVKATKKGAL